MKIFCDGCPNYVEPDALGLFEAEGVQVRYCPECAKEWADFERAHNAEAARLQRCLELWREERRPALSLRVTPLDLPRPLQVAGQKVVLG